MMNFVGSSAHIIKQSPTPTGNGRRFLYADKIDISKPAVVIFGGALTTTEDKAFGYIEHLSNIIKNKSGVDLYAAVYKFGTVDPMLVKANVFRRAGRKMALDMDTNVARRKEQELAEINEIEPTPGYIEDLYEILIEGRIIRGNVAQTTRNLRNLIIYTHCHGAIVVNHLTDMAVQQMKDAGFDDNAIKQCLANVIVIQHNPTAPLENAKFTTLNFMSASDDTLNYLDTFSKNVLGHDDIKPAFMGADYANVFVAGKLNKTNGSEHGFSVGYKNNGADLTPNGQVIFSAEQNAINNAIDSISNPILPTEEQLVSGEGVVVAQMRVNGHEIFSKFSR